MLNAPEGHFETWSSNAAVLALLGLIQGLSIGL